MVVHKSLLVLARKLSSNPKIRRFVARGSGAGPNDVQGYLADFLVAAADADKLGLRDQILTESDDRDARRRAKKPGLAAHIGRAVPLAIREDLELLYGSTYVIGGKRQGLASFLRAQDEAVHARIRYLCLEEMGAAEQDPER